MTLYRVVTMLIGAVGWTSAAAASPEMSERVRTEIMPSFEAMQAAANVHDVDGHVRFLANEPDLIFVINDRRIIGWQSVLEQQRKWWPNGRIDPANGAERPYTLVTGPDFVVLAPDAALLSFVLDAPKMNDAGKRVERVLAISQLWQKRPEGWRVTYVHESVGVKPPR